MIVSCEALFAASVFAALMSYLVGYYRGVKIGQTIDAPSYDWDVNERALVSSLRNEIEWLRGQIALPSEDDTEDD